MQLALRLARQLATALSILLMLGAVLASAQAKTAHAGIFLNAVTTMPCHHALGSETEAAKSPFDLCRDLCMTQAPDTLVAPTGIAAAPSVVTVLMPVNTYVVSADVPSRPAQYVMIAQAPPRPAPYPTSAKLLI